MTGSVKPYCGGVGCKAELKIRCCRYKEHIDVKTEDHFPFAPYNGGTDKCGFFVGDTRTTFLENLKSIKDGNGHNNGEV